MLTEGLRMYGKGDLRVERFELPPMREDEVLCRVVSDSVCMSSYKAALLGAEHKRVPKDIATNPVLIGHEFCGDIVAVGAKWTHQFEPGQRFAIQPALNYKGSLASPGYSYPYMGGTATYTLLHREVMELGCLLPYTGEGYFQGSLAEPMSCIIGAYHATYHTTNGVYVHEMGIREGGNCAILAGAGPMGLGAVDYALHCARRPRLLVVTDIDQARLDRARRVFPESEANRMGVELHYLHATDDAAERLMALSNGHGYDDVFVYAPVSALIEQADRLLGRDGCLNFFAGPTDSGLSAKLNFYNVHYASTHVVGTSGGNTDDMREALAMAADGRLTPACMVTHIGGLDSAAHTTLHLPEIPGGKKLIYPHIRMPLTAIEDFEALGARDPRFAALHALCSNNRMLWSAQAEACLLEHFSEVDA